MNDMPPDPDLYAKAVSFQAIDARRQHRADRVKSWSLAGSFILNLALVGALVELLPLKTVVPIYGFRNEAGLFDTTTEISDLPPSQQIAAVEATLWNYVRDREGFAPSEADQAYDRVSELSSDTVKEQYQTWVNPKLNPESLAKRLGPNGFVRINRVSSKFVNHADDYAAGVYEVHFCRTVAQQNLPPVSQRLFATLAYKMVSGLPFIQRVTFNPAGLVVTEYPGPREEGAPGVPHPCA